MIFIFVTLFDYTGNIIRDRVICDWKKTCYYAYLECFSTIWLQLASLVTFVSIFFMGPVDLIKAKAVLASPQSL